MRCESNSGVTRLFLNNCEHMRVYQASPLTNKRAGIAYQGASASGAGFRLKTLRIATDFDTNQVVCVGDSVTRGIDGASAFMPFRSTYPYLLAQSLTDVHVVNMGRGGDTIAQMVTRSNATSSATDTVRWGYRLSHRPAASKNIAVFFGGINDRISGRTPAQISADTESHVSTLQGESWEVIVLGHMYSASNLVSGTYNDEVDELNALLEASSAFDGYVDLIGDARLADPENATYFDSDKLHLTAAGNAVVAELVAAAVNDLLTPPAASNFPASRLINLGGGGLPRSRSSLINAGGG
jgi:lysophospholipase L1-like esterase